MNAPVIIFFVLAAIAVLGAVSLILQRTRFIARCR